MSGLLSKTVYCLYCIWPMLVIGIAWWQSRIVETKTYYGSLTPGVDPVSPQGQAEFETRRQRNAEKRRIIYWAAGILFAGYLGAYLWSTFAPVKAAEPAPAVTLESSPTPSLALTETATPTPEPSGTPTLAPSATPETPTYAPTATNRVVYIVGPERTVVVTVVVERVITATPTWTPTGD